MPPFVLNEVLYDPPGADGALEYVEIAAAAPADSAASLAGWVLETGNGARPGEWAVAWTGGAGDRLRGGLFLVGESAVEPAPDAVADLDLQNGPDACRLRGPGGAVDVLGWGAPLDPALFERSPAEDVSDRSLARFPDAFDTDDNAQDFLGAAPTPGAFNAPEESLLVEEFRSPGGGPGPGEFTWTVRNAGRRAGVAEVRARCRVHPGEVLAAAVSGELSPGARAMLAGSASPPPGVHLPRSDPAAPADGGPWSGAPRDVWITEVLSRPASGEPEWIEIESTAAVPVDLGALAFRDASGSGSGLSGVLAPGGFALVTSDTAALRARWNPPRAARLVQPDSWPALNHTGSAAEAAERVALLVAELEADVALLPGGADEGVSWERISRSFSGDSPAAWLPSLDSSGATPGRGNSVGGDRAVPVPRAGALLVSPSPFRPERDGAALIVLRSEAASCRMTVFDSWGVRVAGLVPWASGDGEHRAVWDGRTSAGSPAPLGLYVVRAEAPGMRAVRGTLVVVR